MGQITNPSTLGITVKPIDRESGPGAGAGAAGNRALFLGLNAGFNAAQSDIIALGNNALSGSLLDANSTGTIAIGSQAAKSLTTIGSTSFTAPLIIGFNAAANVVAMGSSTIIGTNALATIASTAQFGLSPDLNTVIGTGAAGLIAPTNASGRSFQGNVVIGEFALGSAAGNQDLNQNVIIGREAAKNYAGVAANFNVIIGQQAALGLTSGSSGNVIIGATAASGMGGPDTNNVLIGQGLLIGGPSNNNVAIGNGASVGNASLNVMIGQNALNNNSNSNVIMIGAQVGNNLGATNSDSLFLVETVTGGAARQSMFYGIMAQGSLVIGNSTNAQRDLITVNGTNLLKLINGTKGAANPTGGGYFYSSTAQSGQLHWVDPGGIDTTLSVSVAGQLASSVGTAYTNNAAAAVATLTNAPIAGNPTKWVPVNDNGTIRSAPLW